MGVLWLAPLRAENAGALVWVFGVAVKARLTWRVVATAYG